MPLVFLRFGRGRDGRVAGGRVDEGQQEGQANAGESPFCCPGFYAFRRLVFETNGPFWGLICYEGCSARAVQVAMLCACDIFFSRFVGGRHATFCSLGNY